MQQQFSQLCVQSNIVSPVYVYPDEGQAERALRGEPVHDML